MLTKHPSKIDEKHSIAELNILEVPSIFDVHNFKYQLNSWYYCDASFSQSIDQAMDKRVRQVTLRTVFLEDYITVNLETFSFINETSTVEGFIRWLPKFVTVDPKTKRITSINNFQAITLKMYPVVLTTSILKEASDAYQSRQTTVAFEDDTHIESADDHEQGIQADFIDDENNENENVNSIYGPSLTAGQMKKDEKDDDEENDTNEIMDDVRPSTAGTNRQLAENEVTDKHHELDVMKAEIKQHQKQLEELQSKLNAKKSLTSNEETNINLIQTILGVESEPSQELSTSRKECAKLQEQLELRQIELDNLRMKQNNFEQELKNARIKLNNINHLENLKKQALIDLVSIEYNFVVKDYTPIQQKVVSDYLKSLKYPDKNELKDNLITIDDLSNQCKDGHYLWRLKAYPMHHDEMENIQKRLEKLIYTTQSQQEYHNRVSKRLVRNFLDKCIKPVEYHIVRPINTRDNWKIFSDYLIKLINDEREKLSQIFIERIHKKCKSLVDLCIKNVHNWQRQLYDDTNDFIKQYSVLNSIEQMKQKTFQHFVEDAKMKSSQSVGPVKIERKSVDVRDRHLLKLQQQFESQPQYVGHEFKHFNLIPSLLERVHIYCRCFQLSLPLFDSSVNLLDNIERNTVVAISTGTGSGKSTLMPALLAADNYDKIFVTQPRRLPCNLLSSRVNSCITSISGWAVSGSRSTSATHSPILYLTDGLLKEYLLYRENDILRQANRAHRGIIFFVDEVHERSINIDLCLALLARLLTVHPDIQTKVKIIISSATLGPDVSTLFHRFRFHQETLVTRELHTIKIKSSDENMFDVIHRLTEDCSRSDQILCFVKSTLDVNQSIKLLRSIKKRGSSPLIQSQSAAEQERLIQTKQIFFSTTVAETSLTFPSLKYVVDTGVINMPVYDATEDSTVLREIPAAESTIKQRQGRLGRTQGGEYFSLYKHDPADKKYPTPQICQSELSNIEFSLRRSPLKQGLNYLKQWLPNPPNDQVIELAIKRLQNLDILDKTGMFTAIGLNMAQLPDFGSLAISKAVLAGLQTFNCGRDLIRLASILGVLNTSSILQSIPSQFKRAEGDFMTLLTIMDAILAQKRIVPPHIFDINIVCKDLNLTSISHILKRALLRNTSFESFFNHSLEYRVASQISSNDWCSIAKSLLVGFFDNVYLSQAELQGKSHSFYRYNIYPVRKNQQEIAVIDRSSTLARSVKSIPVSLILVRDIHCSTAVRATSILSFIGEIQAEWINNSLQREFNITSSEKQKFEHEIKSNSTFQSLSKNIHIQLNDKKILLSGIAGEVLITELYIRKHLISKNKTSLLLDSETREGLKRNVANLVNTLHIFHPMIWRWNAEKQVIITFRKVGNGCEVIIEAREQEFTSVRKELDCFIGWLKDCVVLHLYSGISPRQLKSRSPTIEERIARLTDIKLTSADLWSSIRGPQATRESRMEVVAWIAICRFYCKLEGGFVRDWVIDNKRARPANTNPSTWIYIGYNKLPYLDPFVIPSDLDCHLPLDRYFDIERFLDEIYKFEIETKVFRQDWRYVLLFDEHYPTGPFTMDLIEPHVALTHNRIDFDVNNLYVERDHTKDLGQRVDLHEPPCSIDLEQTVENIQKKYFRVLRDVDQLIQSRIDKMIKRGWTQHGETLSFIPAPSKKDTFVEADLPSETSRYQKIVEDFKNIVNARIIQITQLRNPDLENAYEANKRLIANECPSKDPNECFLYHGTGIDNAKSIMEKGYDNRYFSTFGLYGRGAYFADNPAKSHDYTKLSNYSGTSRIIFYNKVVLGIPEILNTTDTTRMAAKVDHHSVQGTANPMTEYIVYTNAQALPFLKITYDTGS
ncbi:unnamed protein product [Rotaria sordida]|uniref:Poly [ADP-ribose] polymerase n=1 Tax=Rotaria sordida TaxID=392033 RepID=A0A819NH20_9BILA|nr:unnamed protein product [Rotaria sordida]